MPRWSARELLRLQVTRRAERVDRGPPQRLVGIDVPDTGNTALVEQDRLDRGSPGRERLAEPPRRELARERLGADALLHVAVELARLEQQPRAEAAYVAVHDVRSVV